VQQLKPQQLGLASPLRPGVEEALTIFEACLEEVVRGHNASSPTSCLTACVRVALTDSWCPVALRLIYTPAR